MRGLVKAFRLEMGQLTESKFRFLCYLLIPVIITIALGEAGGTMNFPYCIGTARNIDIYCQDSGALPKTTTLFNLFASLIFSTSMVFIATQLTVLRIVGERAPYGTLDRDLLAISRSGMFLGKALAGLAVVIPQSALFVATGVGRYNMSISGSPYLFFGLLVMISVFGLLLGLLFSVFTKTKEQAVQLVPFVVLIFLVFSGDLIPTHGMFLATISPLTLADDGLKKIMLLGTDFKALSSQILELFVWIVGILLLGLMKFTSEKK